MFSIGYTPGVRLAFAPMGHPPVLTVVKELEQVAGTVAHLYIVLRGAPILAERIHETRQQVEIVRLQHRIEVIAVKAVEIRRVLHVERKSVGAGRNVDDVGGEIRDLDELLVPGPLFELAYSVGLGNQKRILRPSNGPC